MLRSKMPSVTSIVIVNPAGCFELVSRRYASQPPHGRTWRVSVAHDAVTLVPLTDAYAPACSTPCLFKMSNQTTEYLPTLPYPQYRVEVLFWNGMSLQF